MQLVRRAVVVDPCTVTPFPPFLMKLTVRRDELGTISHKHSDSLTFFDRHTLQVHLRPRPECNQTKPTLHGEFFEVDLSAVLHSNTTNNNRLSLALADKGQVVAGNGQRLLVRSARRIRPTPNHLVDTTSQHHHHCRPFHIPFLLHQILTHLHRSRKTTRHLWQVKDWFTPEILHVHIAALAKETRHALRTLTVCSRTVRNDIDLLHKCIGIHVPFCSRMYCCFHCGAPSKKF